MTARFALTPRPPFRLDLTVWSLRRRAHNAIDRWDGETYRRVVVLERTPVEIAVRQIGPPRRPRIEVIASGDRVPREARREIATTLQRMLGLDRDLSGFYRLAGRDPHLGPLAKRLIGMKPPRFPSLFEALANAVACQQVSLTAGLHVLNRLADAFGAPFPNESGVAHAFPEPRDLLRVDIADLRALGISRQKARFLLDLAAICADRKSNALAGLERLDDGAATKRLCALRGVGRWTAEYALLRGLGRINVFPADDIGGFNKLKRWLALKGKLDYHKVRRRLERWDPYQGLIYFHLLVSDLGDQGLVSA